jgi:hypothetical protein
MMGTFSSPRKKANAIIGDRKQEVKKNFFNTASPRGLPSQGL